MELVSNSKTKIEITNKVKTTINSYNEIALKNKQKNNDIDIKWAEIFFFYKYSIFSVAWHKLYT